MVVVVVVFIKCLVIPFIPHIEHEVDEIGQWSKEDKMELMFRAVDLNYENDMYRRLKFNEPTATFR